MIWNSRHFIYQKADLSVLKNMGAAFIQLHVRVERKLCGRNESLKESATFQIDKEDKEALTCQCSCLSSKTPAKELAET